MLGSGFAMDQEHRRTSSVVPRKWTAPLSSTVIKYGFFIPKFPNTRRDLWTLKKEGRKNERYQ